MSGVAVGDNITVELNPAPAPAEGQRILITGINGMMGSYLAEYYLNHGCDVHGTVRQASNLRYIKEIQDKLILHRTDLLDSHGILDVVKTGFDIIHATASITYVPYSWMNPNHTVDVIVKGTVNLLEAVRRANHDTVFHYFGSSEQYGIVSPEDIPLKESHPLKPHSPYGVAKTSGEMFSRQFHETYGMKTVITRAFNHESERRGREFIGPTIARQAIQIAEGRRKNYSLGNLEAVRDITDYRDIVNAYTLAVKKCDWGEPYNVCSMKGYSVAQIVTMVSRIAGITAGVEVDPARVRPTDIPVLIGDSTKFKEKTGWKPMYSYEDTLKNIWGAFKSWRKDECYD